jgi:hypothetical protein
MTTDHATEMALIEAARAKAEAVWLRCSSPGAPSQAQPAKASVTPRRPTAAAGG